MLLVIAALLMFTGCGGPAAKVAGRVTCRGKAVAGVILFSPKGESESNKGPAVSAPLKDDGSFELQLASIGKHKVVITPSDVKYPVPPGEFDYPCDRSAIEWDVQAGDNYNVVIEMKGRQP